MPPDPDVVRCGTGAPVPQPLLVRRFTLVLGTWVALTSAASLLLPGDPTDLWFTLMVVAPIVVLPALFFLAYGRSARLRATMRSLDFAAITAVQGMRIAGIAMLCLWAAGALTPSFALWAGGLDVVIGLTAVPLAYLVASRPSPPRRVLRTWHALGLLDFVVAVPLGLAASPTAWRLLDEGPSTYAMFSFPLSFIPMVGVPFMVIMHITALVQLRTRHTLRVNRIVHEAPVGGTDAVLSGGGPA